MQHIAFIAMSGVRAASEELNAEAETAMSVVGRLEALVGGDRAAAAATRPAPRETSRSAPADDAERFAA